ncbi:hypothetical protein WAI453_012522 [Rhynchosporium graminicola]
MAAEKSIVPGNADNGNTGFVFSGGRGLEKSRFAGRFQCQHHLLRPDCVPSTKGAAFAINTNHQRKYFTHSSHTMNLAIVSCHIKLEEKASVRSSTHVFVSGGGLHIGTSKGVKNVQTQLSDKEEPLGMRTERPSQKGIGRQTMISLR